MAITAAQVKELRDKTGCGMMECKNALVQANGDFEEAIKILREKGLATAAKKADRIAAEGVVDIMVSEAGDACAIIEVNSETDFVAKNEEFQKFVRGVLSTILANKPADMDALMALPFAGTEQTVEAALVEKIAVIKEKLSIRRFAIVEGTFSTYIHGNGATGVIVKFEADAAAAAAPAFAEFAKNIALQIAAYGETKYVGREDVPAEMVEAEKAVLIGQIKNDPKMANKPEAILEKMVIGRLGKFYEGICLTEQGYVKEDKMTVAQYVAATAKELGGAIKIVSFIRYERGEGIEKRQDDLAAEVAKLTQGQ